MVFEKHKAIKTAFMNVPSPSTLVDPTVLFGHFSGDVCKQISLRVVNKSVFFTVKLF